MITETTPRLPPVAEMEAAYLRRNSSYDGVFYLGRVRAASMRQRSQ